LASFKAARESAVGMLEDSATKMVPAPESTGREMNAEAILDSNATKTVKKEE